MGDVPAGSARPNRPRTRSEAHDLIVDQGRRRRLGGSFAESSDLSQAREYDAMRPRYPQEAVRRLVDLAASAEGRRPRIAELGAGTGILTRSLLSRGAEVRAVEPSGPMAEVMAERSAEALDGGTLRISRTQAESTDIGTGWAGLAVAAQAWHWFDGDEVRRELERILDPGGAAAVIANHLDTSVPWVHRLTRIMRAGDVRRPGWRPDFGPAFGEVTTDELPWERAITPEEIRRLSTTLSSWLTADEGERARRRGNLDWYLDEHLGLVPGGTVPLPYVTVLHSARRRRAR
ncbi:MAG: class I SAM-dependent methyltransferase [Nesterenkonia sp.]|nr:class I SAM-dependent methyltransferase [Nesterenkonia sp.]